MRQAGKTMSVVLLGSLIAACTATDGAEKRDAATNPPAQIVEAASPGDGSPVTTDEGDVSSRAVGQPCVTAVGCSRMEKILKEARRSYHTPFEQPAPKDGGQCLVKAQGTYMTTGGAAGTYNGVELHRWEKVATISSMPAMKTYQFQYTMSVSGFMDQTGAGGQWRGTWEGTATRMETWQAPLVTNPATGQPAFRLTTTPSFSTTVPYTGHLLNPLRPDPRTSATVSAFAQPQQLFSSGTSYVVPVTTGSTKQATGIAWMWSNPLGDATFTCSWNVSL